MQDPNIKHSSAWVNFTFFNFAVSVAMMAAGIFFLPLELATKGFLAMATLMIISSSITVTKTMRDNQEAAKLVSKIEDAKTERLLMDINRGEAA
ncbi:MAG: YiaA/YiaB family inner membrane protein [Pseudomonadota bacterium]